MAYEHPSRSFVPASVGKVRGPLGASARSEFTVVLEGKECAKAG